MLAALLAVTGCGGDPGSPPDGPGDPDRGERVDAELVVFVDKVRTPRVAAVLDEPAEVQAFPGWFAATSDVSTRLAEALADRKPDRDTAIVAISRGVGCGGYGGADLYADGSDLFVRPTAPEDAPEECYAPYSVVAVFAVPRPQIPKGVTLEGKAPQPAGPGTLAVFERISAKKGLRESAADLSREADRQQFLASLPTEAAAKVRGALTASESQESRQLGYVLAGCAEKTALLVVEPESNSVTAVLAGGNGTVCDSAQYFVAVFTVDTALVASRRPEAH